jgi:hypothetical protein
VECGQSICGCFHSVLVTLQFPTAQIPVPVLGALTHLSRYRCTTLTAVTLPSVLDVLFPIARTSTGTGIPTVAEIFIPDPPEFFGIWEVAAEDVWPVKAGQTRETENLCHVGEALAKFSFFLGAKVRLLPAPKKGVSGPFKGGFGQKKGRRPDFEGKKGPFFSFYARKRGKPIYCGRSPVDQGYGSGNDAIPNGK